MEPLGLDIINQAVTNLFIGFGLALVNVIIRYFAPVFPDVITVLRWNRIKRVIIAAYLIALVLQLVTSPFFRSLLHPTAYELAWSPYQALWNVAGVIVMDLIVGAWAGLRRGASVGRQQLSQVKERAAESLGEMQIPAPFSSESREEYAARRQAEQDAAAHSSDERKERLDDRLKDY